MKNIKDIADALRELDDKLARCMKCGSCQAVCPIFAQTLKESDVTRGKLALLQNLSSSIIKDAAAVREKLDRCLLCGSCQANCPSGVSILEIFMRAREICAQYLGLSPVKKIVFKVMLRNPKLFALGVILTRPFNGLFMRANHDAQNTVCAPLMSPFIGKRMLPKMPKITIAEKYGDLKIPAQNGKPNILFFPGCMGDKVYTNVTEKCLQIFKENSIGVRIPKNMACCGIPALASGDAESFVSMAEHNLKIFKDEKFDYIVTACASCTETIKELWQTKLEGEMKTYAQTLQAKTLDISEFLIDTIKIAPKKSMSEQKIRVTYHDSCHLAKGLGVRAQPRKLMRLNPDIELVEMKESDRCCGCGGSFTLTHYDLSKAIGERKRENIVSSKAEVVACGCPACMMQISNMLALHKDNVKVKHVVELFCDGDK